MVARGVGAFAQGLGGGYQAGQDIQHRRDLVDALGRVPAASDPAAIAPASPNSLPGPAGAPAAATSGPSAGLFGLIDRTEGGGDYATLYGHSQRPDSRFAGTDVSQMTIGQALEFASPSGEYGQWVRGQVGRVATPMGRHQIVGTTLRNAAQDMGLSLDTPFNRGTQDAIANHLARSRLASAGSMEGKMSALRSEWEGFRNVSDAQLAAAIQQFEAG